MDITTVTSFLLGLVAGLIAFALALPSLNKRTKARHQREIQRYEDVIVDLRQERADDRETNRRLRHTLAINTPEGLEETRGERDRALDELDRLTAELRDRTLELAKRDRALREARLAIHDIRIQLEQDRLVDDRDGSERGAAEGGEPSIDQVLDDVERHVGGDHDATAPGRPAPDGRTDDDRESASTVFFGEYPLGEPTTNS